jgi:hypothetical protein
MICETFADTKLEAVGYSHAFLSGASAKLPAREGPDPHTLLFIYFQTSA